EHLALFKSDPDRYLPQYKNWCAASVAKGEKVYGNPEWWLVVDGRLYLFGKPIGPGLMSKDPAAMKSQADENWSKVSHLPDPPLPNSRPATTRPHRRQPQTTADSPHAPSPSRRYARWERSLKPEPPVSRSRNGTRRRSASM